MPITVCPNCRSKLRVADDTTAKTVRCPKCRTVFRIETGAAPPAPIKEPVLDEREVQVVNDASALRDNAAFEELEELEELDESADADESLVPDGDPFAGQDVSDKVQQIIHEELAKSEKIVWVGRPAPHLVKTWFSKDLIIGGGFIFASFAGFGGGLSLLLNKNLGRMYAFLTGSLMGLVGLAFFLAGVAVCVFPFLVRIFPSRRPVYVLTNRGALVVTFFYWSLRRYNPSQLAGMKLKKSEIEEGAGDLIFETEITTRYVYGARQVAQTVKTPRGFLNIENVRGVRQLIRQTLPKTLID